MPIFSSVELLAPDFKPAGVFHLAGKMLEGKVPMPSLEMAQAVTEPSTDEDLAKLRAKLAAEAIAAFDEGASQQTEPNPSFDAPLPTGVAYLSDVAARSARERRNLRPGVVRLVNDNNVLVVSRTGGNHSCYTFTSYDGFWCSTGHDWQAACPRVRSECCRP